MRKYLLGGIIPLLVGLAVQELTPYKPFTWIFNHIILGLWGVLMYTIAIPVWGIIVAVFVVWLIYVLVKKLFRSEYNPLVINYKSDTLFGIKWVWNWYDSSNGWKIIDVTPFCPSCATGLDLVPPSYTFGASEEYKCCRCGFAKRDDDGQLLHKVKREIERKVNTKEYVQLLQRKED